MTTYSAATGQTSSPVESTEPKDNKGVSSRRLKKREIDRRCQRQARERTKTRIAYLEGLVEDFRRQDSSGQVATLMKQLQEVEAERELMMKTLKDIQKAMDTHKPLKRNEEQTQQISRSSSQMMLEDSHSERKPSITPLSDDIPVRLKAEGVEVRPESIPARNFDLANYSPPPNLPVQSPDKLFAPEIVRLASDSPRAANEAVVQSRAASDPNLAPLHYAEYWAAPRHSCSCAGCHDRNRSRPPGRRSLWQGNFWRYANEVLAERFDWTNVEPATDAMADDVPIRALVEGWDAVAKRGPLHPSWEILRRIDQTLFPTCPNTERLAIMRAMHLLLQFHTESTTERYARLPPWYMRRPSQNLAHSYAIDYFAWPGVRERFIFNEHDYCGNEFWHLFCKSLRILWPYEFRDCYTREVETGLYKLSPMFDQRLTDIRCWTMGPDFFRRFPELYSDIPAFNHIPLPLSPGAKIGQKKLLSTPSSPKAAHTEPVYEQAEEEEEEEEEVEIKPPPARSIPVPVPVEQRRVHVYGHRYPQTHQTPTQAFHRQHDLNQHMYNVSDFNPIMALDAFAYGTISEADFANAFQPEMPDSFHNVIY